MYKASNLMAENYIGVPQDGLRDLIRTLKFSYNCYVLIKKKRFGTDLVVRPFNCFKDSLQLMLSLREIGSQVAPNHLQQMVIIKPVHELQAIRFNGLI